MRIRKSSTLLTAICLGAALMGTGCSESDSGGAGPSGTNAHGTIINACTLLTMEEAAAILGKPVLQVKSDTTAKIVNCRWQGSVEPGKILASEVVVSAFTTDGFAADNHTTVPAYFGNLKSLTADTLKQQLTGIGTDAIWLLNPRKVAMYKGDVYANVWYRPYGTLVDTSAAAFTGSKLAATKVSEKL
jgi:hypothetical protein